MPNPAWFDEKHFAAQKAEQMNAIAWKDAAGHAKTDWKADDWPEALARFNAQHNTSYTAYDNFLACNTSGYEAGIAISAVNVSPNPFFNIPVYLTNLAEHYNNTGFNAAGYPSSLWTAARALQYLFDQEHISAWDHFKTYGLQNRLNPSNEFDTFAYLEARASKMGAGYTVQDVIDRLMSDGINPIQDYFDWGKTHGINPQAVSKPVEPAIDGAHVWGGPVILPDNKPVDDGDDDNNPVGGGGGSGGGSDGSSAGDKPQQPEEPGGNQPVEPDEPTDAVSRDDVYDEDIQEKAISSDKPVTSPDGQNTWFTGSYDGATDAGLTPNSVINAGADANNSLVMDISASWPGFTGVSVDEKIEPSVTNVGRVVLNNNATDAEEVSFNAQNISNDLEQVDINNAGNCAISLEQLPSSVKTVNIEGIEANGDSSVPATSIAFAAAPASLRIGVENVCATGGGAAPIIVNNVSQVEIASYGTGNTINLKAAQGIEKLVIADGGALTIADSNGASINEYDASAATRSVNIGVSNFRDGAIVKGGSGASDKLTFVDKASVQDANWTGIEELVFKDGGTIDAAKATGISKIVQDGNGDLELNNLSAEHLEVVATENAEMSPHARTCAIMRAQGKIGDVSWSTHGASDFGSELTADFVCDATGDAYITMKGKDKLGVSSVFEFRNMTGTLTIDDPNPTDPDAYVNSSITGVKLQAENATGLNITHTGSMKICGALWKVENVTAKMTDYMDAGVNGLFKLPELPSAHNVDISADRMDVYISGLGSENTASGMELFIREGADVHIDHIRGAAGADPINAMIDSFGDVEIGEINSGGDVNLTVSGVNIVAEQNEYGVNDGFKGASLNLDFSNIHGNVGSGSMLIDLEALGGSLNYAGAIGSDNLLIGALTGGTLSAVDTGSGDDEIVVQTLDSIASGATAVLDVNLGAGNDILRVYSMNQTGNLIVNVADTPGNVIAYECPNGMEIKSADAANAALRLIDAGFQLDAGTQVNNGVFEYGGNAYWIASRYEAGARHVTLVVAEGASSEAFAPDDLGGF